MKIFEVIEGVMLRLSVLPGLSFLEGYVSEHRGKKMRRQQMFGKYQTYVQAVRGAANEVSGATGGSKKKKAKVSEPIEEPPDTDDDFEEVEEDDDDESYMQ